MTTLRDDLQRDLQVAMRARDQIAVSALRSLLAALGNSEAVDAATATPMTLAESKTVAGAVIGIAGAEVERRELAEDDVQRVVNAEIEERMSAAALLRRSGAADRADRLVAEAELLLRYRV